MKMRTFFAAGSLFLTALGGQAPARAEAPAPRPGVFSATFENDTFAGLDRYYTSGARLSWHSLDGAPGPLDTAGRLLVPYLLPDGPIQWGVALGQNAYTPRKTTRRNPPPDDRPYSGLLYGTLSLFSTTEAELGSASLSLGVMGPASGSAEVQKGVHDVLGKQAPEGWDRQLGNRAAVLLALERRWQLGVPLGEWLELGIVPGAGVHLGTVQTSAAGGLLLRLGHGLAMDWGPPRVIPALSGIGVFRPPDGLAWYLFGGLEGRVIAYDGTLEGREHGYWDTSPKRFVAELPIGAELAYRRMRLSFSWVLQSRTFAGADAPFSFGSANFSWEL